LLLPASVRALGDSLYPQIAITRDGRQVVFVGYEGNRRQLYRRARTDDRATAIPGTAGAVVPFLSHDGMWVGFRRDGKIFKMPVQGGSPHELAAADEDLNSFGGAWGETGTIVFNPTTNGGLWRVSERGGDARPLTTTGGGCGGYHSFPSFLPGAKVVLFNANCGRSLAAAVADVETGKWRVVLERAMNPQYADGWMFFGRGTDVYAAPFDPESGDVGAPVVPVVAGVGPGEVASRQFSVSDTGVMVFLTAPRPQRELVRVDRAGVATSLGSRPLQYQYPRISPDGSRIALHVDGTEDSDIGVFDLATGRLELLTTEGTHENPEWVDEQRIAYRHRIESSTSAGWRFSWHRVDRSRPAEPFLTLPVGHLTAFTPRNWLDHRTVIGMGRLGDVRAIVSAALGDPPGVQVIRDRGTAADLVDPVVSPNKRWLAYMSSHSGKPQVYVADVAGRGERLVSDGAARAESIRWSPDSSQVYYRQQGELWSVTLHPVTGLPGRPTPLFSVSAFEAGQNYTLANYDVDPRDGSFVMIRDIQPYMPATHVHMIVSVLDLIAARTRPR
jgi:serine/threonine-protein kinase